MRASALPILATRSGSWKHGTIAIYTHERVYRYNSHQRVVRGQLGVAPTWHMLLSRDPTHR